MERNISSRFAKNASWMLAGRIVQMGLTFITTLYIARYLNPTVYGSITHTYAYVAFFAPISVLGLNEIIVKELIDNKDKNDEIIGTMLVFRIISALLCILVLFAISKIIFDSKTLLILTMLQSISLVFQTFDCITYFYQSKLLAHKTAKINIIAYTLTAIFRIIGLIIKRDVKWFAFAVSLDYIVIAAMLLFIYFKDGHKLKFSLDTGKLLLKRSWHYLFANILIAIYTEADKVILGNMLNDTAVGLYSAATQLCNAWPVVLVAIIDSASPIIIELYGTDKKAFKKKLKQLYASIFYIGLVAAIMITLLSDLIINIVYGSSYADASILLKICSWNSIFAYFGVSRKIWMQCENKLQHEKTIALVGVISNIVLNIVLIKAFGVVGAAIALTLTQFITNFVTVFVIKETRDNAKLIVEAVSLKDVL
ncbi:MAG: flippase [Erysipelotrichaceae bacterium]|nr:flippase [Erysipelotrichaceae bacterium]